MKDLWRDTGFSDKKTKWMDARIFLGMKHPHFSYMYVCFFTTVCRKIPASIWCRLPFVATPLNKIWVSSRILLSYFCIFCILGIVTLKVKSRKKGNFHFLSLIMLHVLQQTQTLA